MFCTHCHKENREIARYCKWCGMAIVTHTDPLEQLVGMGEVKRQLKQIAAVMSHLRAGGHNGQIGLNINTIIIGETGTGKTTIPQIMSEYLAKEHILKKPKLKVVDAVDYERFVDKWEVNIEEAKGGILFFDNVQKLLPDSYAKNVNPLDKLFIEMDKWNNDPIVVLAGLPGGLEEFLENNPAARSRFKYLFRLEPLKAEELYELTLRTLKQRYAINGLSAEAEQKLMRQIKHEVKNRDESFGNAHHALGKAEDLFTAYISHPTLHPGEIQEEDIQGYVPPIRTLDDILAELNSLVGLKDVKEEMAQIAAYIDLQLKRGTSSNALERHYVFTGNPGTGKTTVARIMADILKALGAVPNGQMIEVDRSKLVAGYAGQTSIKTNELIDSAIGGVLFIDEAYTLFQGENDIFGKEAIDTLLKRLEDDRGKFICIAAGYTEEMHRFISSNPGLKSRFNKSVHFEDYNPNELTQIFLNLAEKNNFVVSPPARESLKLHLERIYSTRDHNFGNARDVRTLFENATSNQSKRLVGITGSPSFRQEMMFELTAEDITGVGQTKEKNLNEVLDELDQFIGMTSIKEAIRRLAVQAVFIKQRLSLGIGTAEPVTLNIVLTGNPGTGKTSIARKMGEILKAIGILSTDNVIEVDRNQMVGKYMGETPKLVNALCNRAMGGILFIDEAYTLYDTDSGSGDKYGKEAIEALMKRMEDDKGKFVVIAAGYRKEMEGFMQVNPGLESRFTHRLHIEDYTEAELAEIFKALVKRKQYLMSEQAEAVLIEQIHGLFSQKTRSFGNAREIRRLFDATIQQLSMRVSAIPPEKLSQRDYQLIEAQDILATVLTR